MEQLKERLSLIFRAPLRSDDVNDTMILNRFLANPIVIAIEVMVLDLLLFFAGTYVINVISHLPDMLRGLVEAENYLGLESLWPHFTEGLSLTNICYGLLFAFLVFFAVKRAYELRVSYSEEDINKGTAGTSRWTTLPEIMEQYKRIDMKPSKSKIVPVMDDEIVRAPDGKLTVKEQDLPKKGGSYIERVIFNEDGKPIEKEVKTPNWFKGKGGLPVTKWRNSLYIDSQLTNNLFLGTTRSGKGEMFVFTLLDILSRAEEMKNRPSMIIFDPKLELYKSSRKTLEHRGYATRLLNLDDPKKSAGYNPLAIITEYYAEGKQDEAQQLAKSFSFSIFNSSRDNQEPIWKNTSTDLFTALILAVVSDCIEADNKLNNRRAKQMKEWKNAWKLLDEQEQEVRRDEFYAALESAEADADPIEIIKEAGLCYAPEEYDLADIYPNRKKINCYSVITFFRELCDVSGTTAGGNAEAGTKKADTALDDYFNNRPVLDYARGLYASIKTAGDRTKGSIFVNMQSALTIFSMDSIARMTAENTIDFGSIGYGDYPVAIFLGLPTEDKSNHFLALNFVTQVFQYLFKLAKADNGKLPRNVRFILDEFGNMPILDNFGGMVTNCLGVGFSFDIFIQSYNQLHTNYEMEMDTIKDNFSNQVYILAMGNDTADEFSEQLGKKTIIELQRTGTRFAHNKSFMENPKERPLLFPKELKEFREGEVAIIRGSKRTAVSGAAVKAYPILCEYATKLYFWQKLRIFFSVFRKRKTKNGILKDRDTGEDLSYKQQVDYEESVLLRRLGTAFLYRYEYATSDFPNPNEIRLDDILDETREKIDYTDLVVDTKKMIEAVKEKAKEKAAFRRGESEMITLRFNNLNCAENAKSMLRRLYGENYEEQLHIADGMLASMVMKMLEKRRIAERNNPEIESALTKILMDMKLEGVESSFI